MARFHLFQGQIALSLREPDLCLTTVLGSCISVCLFDTRMQAGGMNHFLLASGPAGSASASYGTHAMALIIEGLLKLGAERARLRAHVFGGASMYRSMRDPGRMNSDFIARFLGGERIPVLTSSTGGTCARRVEFWPASGIAHETCINDPTGPD
ncbi:MAG: chemotaxis protein CheD [Paracoccus sp. (in: a-proteobacteria)]|nr:chemotaxis protein CheD [Paracoccus sp. (in: a-proteobacteria)]